MKEYFDTGIVIKIVPYQDFDAIIDFFLEHHGTLSLIAKGIFKPCSKNKGLCRIGSVLEVEFFLGSENNAMGKLKRLTPQSVFLSEDIMSQSMVSLICEFFQAYLPKNQPDTKTLSLYKEYVAHGSFSAAASFCLMTKFFTNAGLFPDFSVGKRYKNHEKIFWDEKKGITNEPEKNEKGNIMISLPILKSFFYFSKCSFPDAEKIAPSLEQWKELWNVLWWFHGLHCSWHPKSKKIIEWFQKM